MKGFENYDIKFENMLFLKLLTDSDFRLTVMPILEQRFFNPPQGEYPYDLIFKYFNIFYANGQEDINPAQIVYAIQENEKYLEPDDIKKIKKTFNMMFELNENIKNELINDIDTEFLIKETERFAQESAIQLALLESVNILENKPENKLLIRGLLDDALCIGLNKNLGLDYLNQVRERFTFYQSKEDKVPFLLEAMNDATFGGFSRKTLCCFMAGTGIGKTLIMTSLTTDYIKSGYNVLYITLEMEEKRIALRADANLMDIPIGDFGRCENGKHVVSIDDLVEKFENIKNNKKLGRLIIKEFPTGTINSLQIRAIIKELKQKQKFKADVIIVDYINLMNSSRVSAKTANTYNVIKSIAEELRGIAVEENSIIITATQTNRDGIGGNEVALDKVSESAGLPHTTDFFCGLFQTEEQREHGIYILKILKNRFAGNVNKKIAMGVDYNFMRFYQLNTEEQDNIIENDNSDTDIETSTPEFRRRRVRR